jgi:hypothetical protein
MEPLLSMNFQIHHTFKLRKIGFRNTFHISGLGIVIEGAARIKANLQSAI